MVVNRDPQLINLQGTRDFEALHLAFETWPLTIQEDYNTRLTSWRSLGIPLVSPFPAPKHWDYKPACTSQSYPCGLGILKSGPCACVMIKLPPCVHSNNLVFCTAWIILWNYFVYLFKKSIISVPFRKEASFYFPTIMFALPVIFQS